MTPAQIEIASLLKDLGRPPEMIAANAGIPVEIVKAWLRTGRWPKSTSTQKSLFEAGASPRETTKPATTASGHGLHLFARAD